MPFADAKYPRRSSPLSFSIQELRHIRDALGDAADRIEAQLQDGCFQPEDEPACRQSLLDMDAVFRRIDALLDNQMGATHA
jgi:hypothetical protein